MMSNISPQELRESIAYLVAEDSEFTDKMDAIMAAITSHMQAGFEYALGQKPKWNNQMNHEETLELTGQEHLWDEQSERAAEWLLGSKEK